MGANHIDDGRVADRAAIADLYARYAWALNDRDWAAWEAVFTPDAKIDNSGAGGIVGSPSELSSFLATTLAPFEHLLNAVSNIAVDFDGDDTAASRAMFTVMIKVAGDPPSYMDVRGFYRDRLQRTDDGWRVSERVETILDLHTSG